MSTLAYRYFAREASRLDLQRVCNEAPADQNFILITGATYSLLLIRDSFLVLWDQLVSGRPEIGGNTLSSRWGFADWAPVLTNDGGLAFSANESGEVSIDGFHGKMISNETIQETIAKLRSIKNGPSRKSLRRKAIPVNIHYIS